MCNGIPIVLRRWTPFAPRVILRSGHGARSEDEMSDKKFETFEDFWPYYVMEHKEPATRWLHFAGTTAGFACVAGAILLKKRWLFLAAPIVGYGASWIGHFFVEKNRPATFKHPAYSFRGDMRMWHMMVRGKMQAEVDRILREDAEKKQREEATEAERSTGSAHVVGEAVN